MNAQLSFVSGSSEGGRSVSLREFSPAQRAAFRAREDGIARAKDGIDPFWEARVLLRVEPHLSRWRTFTTDDVRKVASPNYTDEPTHPNHWSTLMVKHNKRLWLRLPDEEVSEQKQGHGNKTHRYESLRRAA